MKRQQGLLIPGLLLAAALAGLTVWALQLQQRVLTEQLQRTGYERSVAVQGLFEQLRVDALNSKGSALANNQAFVAYVAQALNLGGLPDGGVDVSSVSDLLGERAQQLEFAVAAVLDASGRVLASSDAVVPRGQRLSDEALLDRIVDNNLAQATVVDMGNGPVLASVSPMQRGGLFDGFLLAGLRLDAAMMEELAQAAAAEVTLLQLSRGEVNLRYSNSPRDLQQQLPELVGTDWAIHQRPDAMLSAGSESLRLSSLFGADQLLLAYHLPVEATETVLQAVARPLLIAAVIGLALLALWLWWLGRRLAR